MEDMIYEVIFSLAGALKFLGHGYAQCLMYIF